MAKNIPCNLCNGNSFQLNFILQSVRKENFHVVRCKTCGLVQVNPQPEIEKIRPYYNQDYFLKRIRRGYANYYSQATRNEILRVHTKNLHDLAFFNYEHKLFKQPCQQNRRNPIKYRSLDVGCASGYFVEFLKQRGWQAEGIELSSIPAKEGRKRGLSIHTGDFLKKNTHILKPGSYHLLSFWACLEHLQDPNAAFLRSAQLLKPEGHLLISTCSYGLLAKLRKQKWRFMNVPEHLYFFSIRQLKEMANQAGFEPVACISYGSGLTKKKEASYLYKFSKKILDFLVKVTGQGDMMALHLRKKRLP